MTKKRTQAAEPSKDQPTFEQLLERLEQVVDQLEEGRLGLSEALMRYEQGVQCLKQCYQVLQAAERKVELLAGVDAEGQPVCEPFEERSMSLEEKQESRGRRRTGPASAGGPGKGGEGGEGGEGGVDTSRGLF